MRIATVALAAILGLPAVASGADPPLRQRLDGLQEKYRCSIIEYLLAIHRRPLAQKHRFLVLSPRLAEGYVQCLFFDKDRPPLPGFGGDPHCPALIGLARDGGRRA